MRTTIYTTFSKTGALVNVSQCQQWCEISCILWLVTWQMVYPMTELPWN